MSTSNVLGCGVARPLPDAQMPYERDSYVLVSLFAMMEHSARAWFRIAQVLTHLQNPLLTTSGEYEEERKKDDREILEILKGECKDFGLLITLFAIDRAIVKLDDCIDRREFVPHVKDIEGRLTDEIRSALFLYIPRERVSYYTTGELFGEVVAEQFPDAVFDIAEAGKCLALGRGTACVFHLMRVMEILLRRLGRLLGIPYAPSWESYLSQIAARIQTKHRAKGIKWKRDEPYFKDVLGDLQAVKIAWRNPTMHVQSVHTLEDAENIFRAVRSLARRLAERPLLARRSARR